jgi:phage major head subunit gpT-like protein
MALQSGKFGKLLEPGLRKVFFDTYKELPEQYSKIYNVQNSNKAIETDLRMGGFGLFRKKDSLGSVNYQEPTATQPIQYIHEEYAEGFIVERKLVDDEQYNQISKMSKSLGMAARASVETSAATIFENAFTAVGYDGQPLISDAHPRLSGSGTDSNKITGALNETNLKLALQLARDTRNEAGIRIQVMPKLLIVPPELEFVATELVESGQKPDTNYNNINSLRGRLKVFVWDYLTSPTAWFLLDPNVAELNFFWRKRLEFKNTQDFDTHAAKYQAYMRYSVGYSDWRGLVGSAG